MTVSIVIAVKTWQNNLEECIDKCQELDYPDFEIIILPDSDTGTHPRAGDVPLANTIPIKVIPTGPVTPAKKRDIALNYAQGEIIAFIDDDAYPQKLWFKNAIRNFADPEVAAVGGPAITPSEDNLRQKASGLVYASVLVSARHRRRYLPTKRQEVDDYPSCNFLVRKSIMQELGGFKTNFWPGEDTKMCLEITKKLNKKIIYTPDVLVYHHRRPVFLPHLKQVANYALHRGYFVKHYPETSLRLSYFIPTLFLFVLITAGILSLFLPLLRIWYLATLSLYFIVVFIFSISKKLRLIPLVFFGITLTHLAYGTYFLKGLLLRKLKEE